MLGLGNYTREDILEHEWLRNEFLKRISRIEKLSPELQKLQVTLSNMVTRDLLQRKQDGTVNTFEADTKREAKRAKLDTSFYENP